MSYIVKSFVMYEVTAADVVVQYLGQWNWIIFGRLSAIPTSARYFTTLSDYWTFCAQYGASPSGMLGSTRINQSDIGKLAMLQQFNPMVLPRTSAAFTPGNYIKLLNNKTGCYAKGQIQSTGVGVVTYDLYDADGTYLGAANTLNSLRAGLPWPTNAALVNTTLMDLTSDGKSVAGGGATYGYGQTICCFYDNDTRVRVYGSNVSGNSFPGPVVDWINGLEGGLDPYEPEGPSGPGGGDGEGGDDPSDIPFPSDPGWSALDTGFIKLYAPSLSELQALSAYLWSGAFDINTFRRIFADPMDAILGLSVLPFAVSAGAATTVTVGSQVTTVAMPPVTDQYKTIDCGSITVHKQIGSYLDYDPITKFEIYLPYLGLHRLAADDIMGKTISLKYKVDVLTGACVAMLQVDGTLLYSWAGNCSQQIPVTSQNWSNVFSGALSVAATGAALVSGGGSFAPLVVAGMANTAINSQKPEIRRSGTLSAMSGMLGVQTPYLIESRPRLAIPSGQNTLIGYPSYITTKLGEVSGYTSVEQVHLEGIPATSAEIAEIDEILKGGCIL